VGVGGVGAARAGSFPIGPRSAADRIAPFVLLLALVTAMIRSYLKQLLQIHPVVQGFEMGSSHCCKLVREQFLILLGDANRCLRFPGLWAITLSHSRTSLDHKRWQLSSIIFGHSLGSCAQRTWT